MTGAVGSGDGDVDQTAGALSESSKQLCAGHHAWGGPSLWELTSLQPPGLCWVRSCPTEPSRPRGDPPQDEAKLHDQNPDAEARPLPAPQVLPQPRGSQSPFTPPSHTTSWAQEGPRPLPAPSLQAETPFPWGQSQASGSQEGLPPGRLEDRPPPAHQARLSPCRGNRGQASSCGPVWPQTSSLSCGATHLGFLPPGLTRSSHL